MEKRELIKKELSEHIQYAESIRQANSTFCTEFYHPKTGRRITYSEKCTLLDIDLDKRVKRIEKLFNQTI